MLINNKTQVFQLGGWFLWFILVVIAVSALLTSPLAGPGFLLLLLLAALGHSLLMHFPWPRFMSKEKAEKVFYALQDLGVVLAWASFLFGLYNCLAIAGASASAFLFAGPVLVILAAALWGGYLYWNREAVFAKEVEKVKEIYSTRIVVVKVEQEKPLPAAVSSPKKVEKIASPEKKELAANSEDQQPSDELLERLLSQVTQKETELEATKKALDSKSAEAEALGQLAGFSQLQQEVKQLKQEHQALEGLKARNEELARERYHIFFQLTSIQEDYDRLILENEALKKREEFNQDLIKRTAFEQIKSPAQLSLETKETVASPEKPGSVHSSFLMPPPRLRSQSYTALPSNLTTKTGREVSKPKNDRQGTALLPATDSSCGTPVVRRRALPSALKSSAPVLQTGESKKIVATPGKLSMLLSARPPLLSSSRTPLMSGQKPFGPPLRTQPVTSRRGSEPAISPRPHPNPLPLRPVGH